MSSLATKINTGAPSRLHPCLRHSARPGQCSRPQRQTGRQQTHASLLPACTPHTSLEQTSQSSKHTALDNTQRIGGDPSSRIKSNGEGSVLREDGAEEGAMDARGGQDPGRPHPELRPQQLARAAQASRAAAVRQELPAPVDQLPAPRHQARQLQQGGRGRHHQPPRAARQQVVRDRRQAARTDGQRDQERLAHAPQEAAGAHQQAGAARGAGSWRRQEAQAQARGRQEGDGPGHHRAGVARTVGGLVVGDRVVVHDGAGAGAGQHGELARVPQGGELHLLLGRRGVPVRRHLLVGDAVHAARELRRPHGALRRAGRVVGWRRRRLGLLAQSVHGVRRRAPGTAADLERAREDFSVPWLIDSSFFSLPLHCTSCIGGRGQWQRINRE